MATILAVDIFICIILNENDKIPNQISPKLVSRSQSDSKPALVQVMARHLTVNKPLSEPMMNQFTGAYMGDNGKMS